MTVSDLLTRQAIIPALKPVSKKQVLQEISQHLAQMTLLGEREIFDALLQREKLGSTGIGNGIAIPHAKFKNLTRLSGLFVRLEKPVDFDSLDGTPIDLIFVLLAPEGAGADHLKGLARIARLLRDASRVKALRTTKDADGIFHLLCDSTIPQAA